MMNLTPQTRQARSSNRFAFTIIELMVALSIASVMILLINRIFFDTTNAVSRGIGLSHIIGESRAISSTLETDFIPNQIAKPSKRGFMFIGFKEYTGIDFPNARQLAGGAVPKPVISDQLLLVLDIGSLNPIRRPLTPLNDNTYSPYTPSPTASYALLWYGHVARLKPDGSDAGEIDTGTGNRFGHQWIVGRQLMFLDDAVPVANVIHADGVFSDNQVVGYITPIPTSIIPVVKQKRWMGLSDVINKNLDFISGDGTVTPTVLDPTNPTVLTGIQYLDRVSRMAYVTERLRVAPNVDPANGYTSWNLAQTHPAFMSDCSDFQITFAGDFDSTKPGMDVDDDVSAIGYVGGSIKWYGYPSNDPTNYANVPPDPTYDASKPAVYDPAKADGIGNATTPGALTLPYYTETNTELTTQLGVPVQVDRGIVFRHDATDVAKQWPMLLRIRYRLHDERGAIESTNGTQRTQGIWFEQIVRIQ